MGGAGSRGGLSRTTYYRWRAEQEGRFGRSITTHMHPTPYAPRTYDYDRPPISRLTDARERARLSLADLAGMTGVSAQVLAQIENRTRRATAAQAEAINQILGSDWRLDEPLARHSDRIAILVARKRLLRIIQSRLGTP